MIYLFEPLACLYRSGFDIGSDALNRRLRMEMSM